MISNLEDNLKKIQSWKTTNKKTKFKKISKNFKISKLEQDPKNIFLEDDLKKILDLEDDLNFFLIWKTALYLLVKLSLRCTQKNRLLACLFIDIAIKKTLKFGIGRRPQTV